MKKWITVCAAMLLIFSLAGCAADQASEETTTSTEAIQTEASVTVEETVSAETAPAETTPAETVLETTEHPESGLLLFTVSEITFSLQGDSEDIYVGTIPLEEITWGSSDESIATFQDGILTATGVGSTTVYAECGDQRIECSVGCLAATEEELAALDKEILRSPKRIPFVVEEWPSDFYNDAAFVGDSITYTLWYTTSKDTEKLGNSLFLVRGGTSLNGFVKRFKNVYYQGVETYLEDAIAASGVKKVFFMMGQNDLSYLSIEETMENWEILLGRILEKSPGTEIYIQSLVPEWLEDNSSNAKNDKIDQYNEELKVFCQENGYYYVEIATYIEDHLNKMATIYSQDFGIHVNYDGTDIWMQALKNYALLHTLELEGE